jgi:hypothetical protein
MEASLYTRAPSALPLHSPTIHTSRNAYIYIYTKLGVFLGDGEGTGGVLGKGEVEWLCGVLFVWFPFIVDVG